MRLKRIGIDGVNYEISIHASMKDATAEMYAKTIFLAYFPAIFSS